MKNYKDENTELKIQSIADFDECLPENLNCSFSGKQMENITKGRRVDFVISSEKFETKQPNFGFCGVEKMRQTVIIYSLCSNMIKEN